MAAANFSFNVILYQPRQGRCISPRGSSSLGNSSYFNAKKKKVIVYLSKYEQRKTKGGNRNSQMKARLQPLKFSKDDIITMLCTNKLLTISTISILIITAISSSYQSCEPLIPVGLRSYYLPAENPHAYRQNKQIKCYMYHCFQIYVNTL